MVAGCQGEEEDTDTGESCAVSVQQTVPAQGATSVHYRGPVEFHLSEPDETASVTSEVAGTQTTREDGAVIVYQPLQPLQMPPVYALV